MGMGLGWGEGVRRSGRREEEEEGEGIKGGGLIGELNMEPGFMQRCLNKVYENTYIQAAAHASKCV